MALSKSLKSKEILEKEMFSRLDADAESVFAVVSCTRSGQLTVSEDVCITESCQAVSRAFSS